MSRIMFRFWLDDTKQEEKELIEQVDELKAGRKFTETIRQGIALITDLRRGSLKVLFELFPYVRAEFLEYVQSVSIGEEKAVSDEREDLDEYKAELDTYRQKLEAEYESFREERKQLEQEKRENTQKQNAYLQEQLDRIEQRLIEQGNIPITSASGDTPKQTSPPVGLKALSGTGSDGGVKQLNIPKIEAPVFDDDDDDLLVIKKDTSSGNQATQNFLNALKALQNHTENDELRE